MVNHVTVEPMSKSLAVWRCLHQGPLNAANLENPAQDPNVDWPRIRARNVPLIKRLMATYGTCAIVARDGDSIVGTLRFYPMALCTFSDSGVDFCLQQEFPAGPPDQMAATEMPPADSISDKTLFVHCLMVVAPREDPEQYRRKDLATRMAKELINWSIQNGWTAIEANAYEEIPTLYAISGVAGRRFWEKLSFQVVHQDTEPGIKGEILERVRKDAIALGIRIDSITNRYRMRLELPGYQTCRRPDDGECGNNPTRIRPPEVKRQTFP